MGSTTKRSQPATKPKPKPEPEPTTMDDPPAVAADSGAAEGDQGAELGAGDDLPNPGALDDLDDAAGAEPGAPAGPGYVVTDQHRADAAKAVWMVGKGVQLTMAVELGAESRAAGIEAIAPVLAKHDAGAPAWWAAIESKYREEIKAGMWLGGVLVGALEVRRANAQQTTAGEGAGQRPARDPHSAAAS